MTNYTKIENIYIYICMQNTTTQRRRATQSFRKIYLSHYSKELCVRGSWRPNRTATYWPPLLWPSAFLSRSPGLLNRGAGGPSLSVTCSHSSILSLIRLISKLTDFLSSTSYIIVHAHLLVGFTIALIQPIYGQGYNSDIPRPDAPVIYIGDFLFWQPGRVVGQYTTGVPWVKNWRDASLAVLSFFFVPFLIPSS